MQVMQQYAVAPHHTTPQPIRTMPMPGTPGAPTPSSAAGAPLWSSASYITTPRRPSASLTPLMSPAAGVMLDRTPSALSPAVPLGTRSPMAGTLVSNASVTSRGSASSYKRSNSPRISTIQDIARRDLSSVGYPLMEPPDEAEPLPPHLHLAPEPDPLSTPPRPPPRPRKTLRIPKAAPAPTYQQMYIFHGAEGLNTAIGDHASRIAASEAPYDPVEDARHLAPEPLHVGPELLQAGSDQWDAIYNKPPYEAADSRRSHPGSRQGADGGTALAPSSTVPGSVVAGTLPRDSLPAFQSAREPFGSLPPPFYMDGMVSYSVPQDVALYFNQAPLALPARESFPGSVTMGSVMQSPRVVVGGAGAPRPPSMPLEGPPMLSFPLAPRGPPSSTPRGGWPWPDNAVLMDDLRAGYSVPKDGIHYWGRDERLPSLEDGSRARYAQYK